MVSEYSDLHHITVTKYYYYLCGHCHCIFKMPLETTSVIKSWNQMVSQYYGITTIFVETTVTVIQCIIWQVSKYNGK